MKRSNIIIGIILTAMTAAGYGQLAWVEGKTQVEIFWEKVRSHRNMEVYSYSVPQREDRDGIENWMYDLHSWAHHTNTDRPEKRAFSEVPECTEMAGDEMNTPGAPEAEVIAPTANFVDLAITENEIILEPWMAAPFDAGLNEEEIILEPWMTAPFDAGLNEEEIILEPWMTAPFDAGLSKRWLVEAAVALNIFVHGPALFLFPVHP